MTTNQNQEDWDKTLQNEDGQKTLEKLSNQASKDAESNNYKPMDFSEYD